MIIRQQRRSGEPGGGKSGGGKQLETHRKAPGKIGIAAYWPPAMTEQWHGEKCRFRAAEAG
jgi:hypothetical protein